MILASVVGLINVFSIFNSNIYTDDKSSYIKEYFDNTEYSDVAIIITAQSILETGWFKSSQHNKKRNLFSIKDFKDHRCKNKPIHCLKVYRTFDHSILDMCEYLSRKNYSTSPENYYKDLVKKGYAEDPDYVKKLKYIVKLLIIKRGMR